MQSRIDRKAKRVKIRRRIRGKVQGTSSRPRLAVYRTAKHIYVQAIDDLSGATLAQASSVDKEVREGMGGSGNIDALNGTVNIVVMRYCANRVELETDEESFEALEPHVRHDDLPS